LLPPPGIETVQRGETRSLVTLGRYFLSHATRGNRRSARWSTLTAWSRRSRRTAWSVSVSSWPP